MFSTEEIVLLMSALDLLIEDESSSLAFWGNPCNKAYKDIELEKYYKDRIKKAQRIKEKILEGVE